jgi:hypothetical protein
MLLSFPNVLYSAVLSGDETTARFIIISAIFPDQRFY